MNHEGYKDPTAEEAVRRANRLPGPVYRLYKALNKIAGQHGYEIIGLREKKTGKEWKSEYRAD